MADTVTLDPGAGGAVVATDDAGVAGQVQINKLAISADGDATLIPADAAQGLDVDVTRSALPSGAATSAKQDTAQTALDAIKTAVEIIDNVVAGTEAQVDVLTLPALPAGTNNIGDVDILTIAAGDNNIGNVDIVTSALPTGASTSAKQDTAQTALDAIKTAVELLDDAVIADDAAFTVGTTKTHVAGFFADQASTDSVNEGDIGAARMTLDRKQIVTCAPSNDTEGLDAFRSADIDETEEDVKTSAGKLYGWAVYNDGAAEVFLQFWNATAANTTPGTTTPKVTFPIPAGSAANIEFTNGITFDTAISLGATTGFSDAGAPAAAQVSGTVFYK